jgi:copper chaperone
MENVLLNVGGMSCEHCVKAIQGAVGALPGVAGVRADLASKTVAVEFDPAATPIGAIRREIEEQGYDVLE